MGIRLADLPKHVQEQIVHGKGVSNSPAPQKDISPLDQGDGMNKTERRHSFLLELWKREGKIIAWRFEPFRLRLAKGSFYKPDFLVVFLDHFEIHETKGGFAREASTVRLKVAARLFPWFRFKRFWYTAQGLREEEIKP